jgi:prephenate dehydrogenase
VQPIARLGVIGVGVIGGSIALALRRAGLCGRIIGCARDRDELAQAQALGIIDEPAESVAALGREAEVIVVAVPVGSMQEAFAALAPVIAPEAIVTDVGSVKSTVVSAARAALGVRFPRFVPGHPIAGTERNGPTAAFADLYRGQRVVLTPVAETDADALGRVTALWQALGASVDRLDPATHDRVLAATSHLPHALAYLLVDCLLRHDRGADLFRYAGGGFRDFTRIAASNPDMWLDILFANRAAVGEWIGHYAGELQEFAAALSRGDGDRVRTVLDRAAAARRTRVADPAPR